MINMQDFIKESPFTRKIAVDELLFAEFKCPHEGKKGKTWWHDNFFAHVLTGSTVLKTPKGEYVLKPGETVFARKGSVIGHNYTHQDFCELLVFVPDDFIKTVAHKYKTAFRVENGKCDADTVMPLASDEILTSYFQSLLTHFKQPNPPDPCLLKLKFEELILNILSSANYTSVNSYFSEVCRNSKPSIREIMELNFFSNLSMKEFARLCARSLSAFKREFIQIYNVSPGKWLMEKRLEYSHYLLETTDLSIDDLCMECGFENRTHFIRVFKKRFGITPGKQKLSKHHVLQAEKYA